MALIIVVLLCLIIFGILYIIPGYTPTIKDSQGHKLKGSIAKLEKVMLGGTDQWILIRGVDTTKPVILFLHGGPGTADMCVLRRHMSALEKHFVVVSWDQRGAGKSFAANHPETSMKIGRFIEDAHELSEILCRRFDQNKIFLAGHSWGSVLGMLTAHKYPHLYHAYIGIGQIANMQLNEKLSYRWTLEQAQNAHNKKNVKKLTGFGEPPYSGKWQKKFMAQRRILGKYSGEVYGNSKGAFPVVISSLLRATEYTLQDKINFFRGIFATVRMLWPELMTVNLSEKVPDFKVPVYFFLGRHDHEGCSTIAEQYFKILDAPYKELVWFENSAHLPNIEENKKFIDLLVNHVLKADHSKEKVTA